jgi:capsular exopolysaccharide synthesis family protein
VVENKTTGNAEVVEAALPPETGSTGRLIFLTLGGLAGLLLATTSMAIADNRDKSLRNLKDIKALFGFPLLGVIPSFDEKSILRESGLDVIASPVLVRDVPGSFISEVYRMIQANLRSLGGDRKLKVVLVTSSVDGEGKSTVAANLAAAMAQLGRNILLVDADLRNPAQHDIWQLSNLEGLSNLLSGQTGVSPTLCPGIEHLEILTAGEVTSNPLALLDTQTMTSLIESAADRYDLIVIDAPSLLTKADALSLSQISDSILLVARPGVVDRESAAMAKETLERSDRNILGLVVNGANRNDFTSSLYYPKLNMVDGEFSHLNQLGATNALSDAGLPAYSEK